jgi:hypothetical protein
VPGDAAIVAACQLFQTQRQLSDVLLSSSRLREGKSWRKPRYKGPWRPIDPQTFLGFFVTLLTAGEYRFEFSDYLNTQLFIAAEDVDLALFFLWVMRLHVWLSQLNSTRHAAGIGSGSLCSVQALYLSNPSNYLLADVLNP